MTDTSGGCKTIGYKRPPHHTRFQPGCPAIRADGKKACAISPPT